MSVPIVLANGGGEHAVAFSLTFDPTVLGGPSAALPQSIAGGTLTSDASQATAGKFGVLVMLPGTQTLAGGTQTVAVVNFMIAAAATVTNTAVGFTDAPTTRLVSSAAGATLPLTYDSGLVTILRGFEADLLPRPTGKGDGTVRVTDWVQVGRFVVGLDTPSSLSEFARADCAPRSVNGVLALGDGVINLFDFVQAGRYAAALDPVTAIGGPTAPLVNSVGITPTGLSAPGKSGLAKSSPLPPLVPRAIQAGSVTAPAGQTVLVPLLLTAAGDENAASFSLDFDPQELAYMTFKAGADAPGATVVMNTNGASSGRLGVLLALSAGQTFSVGTHEIMEVEFTTSAASAGRTTQLTFGNQPVAELVADPIAEVALPTPFLPGTITVSSGATATSLKLALISAAAPGSLQMRLTGATPGQYALEVSTDLKSWTASQTLNASSDTLDFSEASDAKAPGRFYRVRLLP